MQRQIDEKVLFLIGSTKRKPVMQYFFKSKHNKLKCTVIKTDTLNHINK